MKRDDGVDLGHSVAAHENSGHVVEQCIRNTRRLAAMAERLTHGRLEEMQAGDDPVGISEMLLKEMVRL